MKRRRDPELIHQRYLDAWAVGDYETALRESLTLVKICKKHQKGNAYALAACCNLYLSKCDAARKYSKLALASNKRDLLALDVISDSSHQLGELVDTQKYGRKALDVRDSQVRTVDPILVSCPPPPSQSTKQNNIISFSLFGSNPKYCETAILNAQLKDDIYPDWTCRFYIDKTVPENVIERLRAYNSQIRLADNLNNGMETWTATMWRFAAYDEPSLHRVLFRDADSIISLREAKAVRAWISSGKAFHSIRDFGSHTELLQAGLIGCIAGALPPMSEAINEYMKTPPKNLHFADQFFLRENVWPYARSNLISHDSVFAWGDAMPMPDGPPESEFHVGCVETSDVGIHCDEPDGTEVVWSLIDISNGENKKVCSYSGTVTNGCVNVNLPKRWMQPIEERQMIFNCTKM